ncbi:MAG: cupin domain-containing protein, partial [Gemmatimonadota bacterium]
VVTSSVLELAPGAVLTNPHRHDAALFGYVLEGAILTSLEHGPIQRYEEGEMFHEPLRILHTHFENPDPDMPAQVLLVTIAKPPQP